MLNPGKYQIARVNLQSLLLQEQCGKPRLLQITCGAYNFGRPGTHCGVQKYSYPRGNTIGSDLSNLGRTQTWQLESLEAGLEIFSRLCSWSFHKAKDKSWTACPWSQAEYTM